MKYDNLQFAQGDTLLTRLKTVTDDVRAEFDKLVASLKTKKVERDEFGLMTVAYGETHGHAHAFKDEVWIHEIETGSVNDIRRFIIGVPQDTEYHHVQVKLNDPEFRKKNNIPANLTLFDYDKTNDLLVDDRHAPHKIPKGLYEGRTQIEADLDGLIRPVVD